MWNKTNFLRWRPLALLWLTTLFAGCGGSDGGGSTIRGIQLSGTVQVSADDANAAGLRLPSRALNASKAALGSATVSAYKIFADGTASLTATTTTDGSGNYSLENLAKAKGENGLSTDFYYELRVTASNLDVRAPAAPTTDSNIDITPQTNLAARIISSVVDVPGAISNPTPALELIEATRRLVTQNTDALSSSITVPSVATTAATATTALASGIAAAGGNAEKMYKATQFASEYVYLTTSSNQATAAQAASYLKRVLREGCNQPSTPPLPFESALVLGQALLNGTTYTAIDVVTAYNAVASSDVTISATRNQFKNALTTINTNIAAAAGSATAFSAEDQLLLYVRRDLGERVFLDSTPLDADQALAFLMSVPGPGSFCQLGNVNITAVLAGLTSSSTLAAAHIADTQIYHDSGFGCNQNSNQGHFRADIEVYAPTGTSVTAVQIVSTDTGLNGTGTVNLAANGTRWTSNTNGLCVTLGQTVTYTVTATLSPGGTITSTVSRNHPLIPEASTTVNGTASSTTVSAPTIVTDKRPVYTWESPATKLAQISSAPSGSRVKYTYEFAHINATDNTLSPLSACNQVSSGALYEVNSFLPTTDCDPAACATAAAVNATDVLCRMNVQTYLVDESDRLLGQSSGHFPVFCVDTNSDGDCGD